jgi:NIMA-interacting peptidyl-prolyl cis-trans isomerase 1
MSQVQCLHILKKHAGSRRPSSWRQEVITQSKADAISQIEAIRAQIAAKGTPQEVQSTFRDIASRESDCSSAQQGGDLGLFSRGQVHVMAVRGILEDGAGGLCVVPSFFLKRLSPFPLPASFTTDAKELRGRVVCVGRGRNEWHR